MITTAEIVQYTDVSSCMPMYMLSSYLSHFALVVNQHCHLPPDSSLTLWCVFVFFPLCRHLCLCVDAHSVYWTLAEILFAEENLTFASLMVQVLNMILFTATELYELRMQLRDLQTPVREGVCRCVTVCVNSIHQWSPPSPPLPPPTHTRTGELASLHDTLQQLVSQPCCHRLPLPPLAEL